MSIVDVNAILSGTPYKRIMLGYQSMKEAYNESSAEEFFNIYSKESLKDILDNSEYIFTECYKGLDFYKNIITNPCSCVFTRLIPEFDKVSLYYKENSNNMNDDQKNKFNNLLTEMSNVIDNFKDVILITNYINSEKEDNHFEESLSSAIYEKDSDKVFNVLEKAYYDYTLYTYAPFVCGNDFFNNRAKVNNLINESVSTFVDVNKYIETAIVMDRNNDNSYIKELSNLGNIGSRHIIESFIHPEPIMDTINRALKITDKEAGIILHEDIHDAVNSIFDDILEAALFDESNSAKKEKADIILRNAYDTTMELLTYEHCMYDNTDSFEVHGYSLLTEGTSFDEAYKFLSENASMVENSDFFESTDEDDDDVDNELDSLSKDIEGDKDESKSDNIKLKKVSNNNESKNSLNRPLKPKAKNLATKIQTKAQDLEVKQMGAYSNLKQHGDEIKRAAKAVAALPKNVYMDIKNQINALNEKDLERRRAYMTEPGFRRKAFRNLKLAILYGSAAQMKLSSVPVIALIRHFSKTKDKFVRKELERDLATEIKVCEAKIEDAANNNDQKEKYRLIRLRDKLERERIRVLLNSKKM